MSGIKKRMSKGNKHIMFFSIALIVIIIDQITKLFVRGNLGLRERHIIIPNFFHLYFIKNTGAGFSLLEGQNTLLVFISLIVIGLILFYYDSIIKNRYHLLSFALIIGGAVGNLIDRIALGYVTDFLDFYIIFDHYPAFNIADSAITIGAIILLISIFTKK